MRKVPALRKGDMVGFVSPSSPPSSQTLEKAIAVTEGMGFTVKTGASCGEERGYMVGPDETRAADINMMFADSAIKAIFCTGGGYGAARLLPLLDEELIFRNPKIFLGYSDATALHQFFNRPGGFCTFHGPMPASDFTRGSFDGYCRESLFEAMTSTTAPGEMRPFDGAEPMKTLVDGTAEGEFVGGNLSMVCALLGTPWETDVKGRILLLEETCEPPCVIDRMLTQLRLAGKFDEAAGVVMGQFTRIEPLNKEKPLTLEEIFSSALLPAGKPTLVNGYFGHGKRKATATLGARVVIDGSRSTLTVVESGVC